jgi:hypothetical protein
VQEKEQPGKGLEMSLRKNEKERDSEGEMQTFENQTNSMTPIHKRCLNLGNFEDEERGSEKTSVAGMR